MKKRQCFWEWTWTSIYERCACSNTVLFRISLDVRHQIEMESDFQIIHYLEVWHQYIEGKCSSTVRFSWIYGLCKGHRRPFGIHTWAPIRRRTSMCTAFWLVGVSVDLQCTNNSIFHFQTRINYYPNSNCKYGRFHPCFLSIMESMLLT